jgi:hypothetical protein
LKNMNKYTTVFVQVYTNWCSGQCSDALQDKLKSRRDFDAYNQNGISLLLIV